MRFPGNFVYVFPFSPGKRETHQQFDPTHFRDNPAKLFIVYWFFSPPSVVVDVDFLGLLDCFLLIRWGCQEYLCMLKGCFTCNISLQLHDV